MELTIVRHGQCLGQTDPDFYADPDSALTPLGEEQSIRTGERLQNFGIKHIVSSPLQRALATASIISQRCGNLPIQVWPGISEFHSESYRGLPPGELIHQYPLAVLAGGLTSQDWVYGNVTYADIFERCRQVLLQLKNQYQANDSVLMVTHGGFANYLLHAALNIPAAQPTWFEMGNCAISKLRFIPNPEEERPNWPLYPPVQVEMLSLNDTAHLPIIENP